MAFPNHLDTLKAVRSKYPDLVDAAQAVAILNEVAWIHRGEGFGLLRKDGGNHGPQPRTGVLCSCDWLVNSQFGVGGDVLIAGPDATVNERGKATPTWGGGELFDSARFVAPVEPESGEIVPTPGTPATTDLEELRQGQAKIETAVSALAAAVSSLVSVLATEDRYLEFTDAEKAYVTNAVAQVTAAIKAQRYKASNRYFGTITLEPAG
jgi:hypothetical protein